MNELIEAKFIATVLDTKDWNFVISNNVTAKYFDTYSAEFTYLKNYYEYEGKVPDKDIFISVYPQDISFLDIECNSSLKSIFDILKTDYLGSVVTKAANNFNSRKLLKSDGPEAYVEELQKYIKELQDNISDVSVSRYYTNNEFCSLLLDKYHERQNEPNKVFFRSGLNWLDSNINNGFNKDEDYVFVGGRPGVGKSMLLCLFAAEQMKAGRRVAFYEGEMSVYQTLERMIAHNSGISETDILLGAPGIEEAYKVALDDFFIKSGGNMSFATPQEFNGSFPTVNQLEAFCSSTNAEILFIDQITLLKDIEGGKGLFEQETHLSRQLKNLQAKLGIPIVVAGQLNRGAEEEEKATLASIYGSDGPGQFATLVLFLGTNRGSNNKVTLSIAKNRAGAKNIYNTYEVDFATCQFKEEGDGYKSADYSAYIDNGDNPF